MAASILLFGGSFDPPHYGHLKTALAVQQYFSFERFVFLPCKVSVLKKTTHSSIEHRLALLQRALEPYPFFEISLQEITRNTPSFMVETLENYRAELGNDAAITLLIGHDSFLELPQWHRFETLLSLCHLLVIERPNTNSAPLPNLLQKISHTHEIVDKLRLETTPCGAIYRFNAGSYDISSTKLRSLIQAKLSVEEYLPKAVSDYIQEHQLYS